MNESDRTQTQRPSAETDRTQTQFPRSEGDTAPPPSEWSMPEIPTPGLQTTPQNPNNTNTPSSQTDTGARNSPVPGYRILQELGRGGMGIVFKALQVKLNRVVALKMVRAGDDADARELIRFLAEAESAAAVKHPNVVQVYDYGDASGHPFMALEYCPGGTLQDWIQQHGNTVNIMKAVAMVQQIARGVGAAHEAGIVHRDLKPANVLFDSEGVPKVADFGLAKRTSVDITKTDAVMGTPAYMSPEQATGRTKFVGPQADVWALGVILFECVTGRRPFEAENSFSLIQKVANEDAPGLRSITHAVNQDLDLICRKCLSKNPLERYATAGELAEELGRFLRGEPVSVRKPLVSEQISRWIRKKPAVAAAYFFSSVTVILLGVGAGFAHLWHQAEQAKDQTALALTRVEEARDQTAQALNRVEEAMTQVQASRAREQQATEALARREYARTIEYARSLAGTGHTPSAAKLLTTCKPEYQGWEWDYVNKLSRPETFSLSASEGPVYCLAYRPDGKQLATVSKDGMIRFWNPRDGSVQGEIASNSGAIYVITYDPVRNRFATGGKEGRLRIWDASEKKVLFQSPEVRAELATLVYSPNGQFLVSGYANGTFRVCDPDGKEIVTVKAHKEAIASLSISADGSLLATGSYDKTIQLWDTKTWKARGNPMKGHVAAVTAVAFSPDRKDGFRLVSGSDDGNLNLWEVNSGRRIQTFYLGATDAVVSGLPRIPADPMDIHSVRLEVQQPPGSRPDSRSPVSPQGGASDFTPTTGIPISDLAYSPNGRYLVVGRQDGTAMIVRFGLYETRVTRTELQGEFRRGNWLRMIESRPLILTMMDRHSASQLTLHGHVARINSVAFRPDGQQIATCCETGITKLWSEAPQESEDILDTRYAGQLEFVSENSLAVISAYGERRKISSEHTPPSHYRNLKYQLIAPPLPTKPLKKGNNPVNDDGLERSLYQTQFRLAQAPKLQPKPFPKSAPRPFPPDSPRPSANGDSPPPPPSTDPSPPAPTTAPTTTSAQLLSGVDHPFAVGVSRGGTLVAVAERGELYLHRYDLGIPEVAFAATLPHPVWGILGLSATPVRIGPLVWPKATTDMESPQQKNPRSSYSIGSDESITDITAIALDSRGKRVAAARRDGHVAIWNTVNAQCLRAYAAHEERVHALTFSPDDTRLVSGSEDNTAIIWNVETGERQFTLSNKQIDVTAISFSPDGTTLITGGDDGTLRCWDPVTGILRSTLPGHTARINVIAFCGDGKRYATAAIDRTLRLWNTEQMLEVLTLEPGIIHALKFSPSGDAIAAAMSNGGVKWISRRHHKHPLFPAATPVTEPAPNLEP